MRGRAGAGPEVSLQKLAGLELFRSLSMNALDAVRVVMRADHVAKNTIIFEQGSQAERAYALGEGGVRIVQTGSNGGQAVVRFISPGEMFGTVPLFTDHCLPAEAVTAEASLVLSWSEKDLLRMIDLFPPIALNAIGILGTRLSQIQERLCELTTQRAEQRIAQAVLRLVAQVGRRSSGGMTIDFPLRRRDLAEYSGTTLHTASRTLAAWEKMGLLASKKGRLTISNISKLRHIAEAVHE